MFLPRSRVLPADVAARLSSSPALAAAAQHWGLPRKARGRSKNRTSTMVDSQWLVLTSSNFKIVPFTGFYGLGL